MILLIICLSIFVFLPSDAAPACPDGSVQWNSYCYVLNTTQTQFVTAAYACQGLGGQLASIHDAFTDSLLTDYVSNHVSNVFKLDFWTGASKLFKPDTWTWMDNTSFDFTDWDVDEPRNATWAKCINVFVPSGRWSAADCTTKRPYFCQFPLTKPTGCTQ